MTLYYVLISGLWISCCYSQATTGPHSMSVYPSNLFYSVSEWNTITDIHCTASCSPSPCMFSWERAGVEVSNTSVLTLGSVTRDEEGQYLCTARNTQSDATNTSRLIVVTVIYGPDSITLYPPDRIYNLLEGNSLTNITCSADCYP
ncbi:hypothetical protein DPMN_130756 [Dreissena polymorpha]|uniref:Ig-like domain-containing protein n=1 Tax=Dreissena polymorpha TaxID=45954 RepID=A0A9D4H560_DREPO|nr:hypothetical protein DPMN_130756 [Dreissena polymorpha]